MINYSNLYKLYDLLGEIIFYGFHNDFSSEYIEESVSSSIIFRDYLDKSNDSFINTLSQRDIFLGTYSIEIIEEDLHQLNTICMWLGEAYLRLYFKYHKSMQFIFLYFPLDKMSYMFGVYHEMDWTQLYQYFEEEIEKKSILSLLLKKRGITSRELSVLTGIKYQTIKNYSRSNSNVYSASFSNVSKIAYVLNVNSIIFVNEINNCVDASYLDLAIKNIKFLSYYASVIISYFDKEVSEACIYDDNLETVRIDNHFLKVLVSSSIDATSINNEIKEYQDKGSIDFSKTFLVIYIDNDIENIVIRNNKFKKVFVLTPQLLFICGNGANKKMMIPSMLHEAAIRLSKNNAL